MRVTVRATRVGTIADYDTSRPDLQLATDSQDVEYIKEYFGNRPAIKDFDGFLVKIEDGEYTEVYGFEGNIAWTSKPIYKITRTFSSSDSPKHKSTKKTKSKARKRGSTLPTSLRGMRR